MNNKLRAANSCSESRHYSTLFRFLTSRAAAVGVSQQAEGISEGVAEVGLYAGRDTDGSSERGQLYLVGGRHQSEVFRVARMIS